jgi:hypothetical protein
MSGVFSSFNKQFSILSRQHFRQGAKGTFISHCPAVTLKYAQLAGTPMPQLWFPAIQNFEMVQVGF